MSHPGPDLVLHPQVRSAADQSVAHMGHLTQTHQPQHPTANLAYSADSLCHPQAVNPNNFPAYSAYANLNHPAATGGGVLRPVSRQSHDGGNLRHASGGSHTSSHRATPPSPDDLRSHSLIYKQQQQQQQQQQNLQQQHNMERGSRSSFDQQQGQCNSREQQQSLQGSSPGGQLHRGSSPRTQPPRGMPPSPASNIPQKMPYDLTNPFQAPGRSSEAAASTVLMPPFSPAVSVKQEPGSPAHYASLIPARVVKQEPNLPHSPQQPQQGGNNINATPPPNNNNNNQNTPHGYPGMQQERAGVLVTNPGYNYPSPQSSNPISPASGGGGGGATGPDRDTKFSRYQNSGKPVQTHSPGESNCNSAISSREGTPGPKIWSGDDMSGLAPNVDITRVQVKEEMATPRLNNYAAAAEGNDYSRRPSVNISYPAAATAPARSSSGAETYSTYTPTFHHSLPQQVSIPHRSINPGGGGGGERGYRPSVGRPPMGVPGNSEVSIPHSNVKIGRRPAHLPKVLKFEDHTLPPGWQRKLKQRKHGKQAGRWDVYIYSPCGVKFASRKKLKHFFEKNNLQYDAEQFDFTPYGKHIENAPHRNPSSSSEGNRQSGSPGSVHSPSNFHANLSSEFIPPSSHPPPAAHHSYMPPLPAYEFNPMMESPPNANAREIPHNQILNLSQTPSALPLATLPRTTTATAHFPSEIDDILNENAAGEHFRNRLRDYNSEGVPRGGNAGGGHSEDENGEDLRRGGSGEETERGGFMATSINILSDGNMDMDMNNINMYPTY